MTAADLAWVEDFVGVPYAFNGRTRDGWDCWGVVLAVFRERLGVELPEWFIEEEGGAEMAITNGAAAIITSGRAVQIDAPEEWAIVMVHRRELAHHVGVVVGGYVMHCARPGTVCEPLDRFLRSNVSCTFWRWQRGES